MNAVKTTFLEAALLGVLGSLLGFGYNAVRGEGSLQPTKNYFDKGLPVRGDSPISGDVLADGGARIAVEVDPSIERVSESSEGRPKHRYQKVDFDRVLEILNDPNTELGLNVFVDARSSETFQEGHIPGAIQCNPYRIEACIDDLMNHALGADRVVVYCGGGDCEDSIFMCRELLAAGLEYGVVYLYDGGWKEWEEKAPTVIERGE